MTTEERTSPWGDEGGWFRVYRQLWTNPLLNGFSAHHMWVVLTIFSMAQYRHTSVGFGSEVIRVPRGSLLATVETIAKLAGRGITPKMVRTVVEKLIGRGLVTAAGKVKGRRPRLLTIVDYDEIQGEGRHEGANTDKRTGASLAVARAAGGPQKGNIQEGEEGEEGKEERNRLVASVFGHWQRTYSRADDTLTPKRRRTIEDRLNEGFGSADLTRAIDGARRNAWYSEGREDLAFILGSRHRVEELRGATRPKKFAHMTAVQQAEVLRSLPSVGASSLRVGGVRS